MDLPTLQFADFVVFLTCGLMFLCGWLLRPSRDSFLHFGASYLLCAFITVGLHDFAHYASALSVFGWSIAGLLFWSGFRVFDGRRPVTLAMAAFTALPIALFLVTTGAGASVAFTKVATTLAYAAHGSAIALYLFSTSQGSTLRKVAGGALLASVATIVAPRLAISPEVEHAFLVSAVVTDLATSVILTTVIFAIESERAYGALSQMAHRDPLTGALNRLGFEREVARRKGPANVIVADLDHFKTVNDRLGHSGGDHVLRTFVRRATAVLPEASILARFGGEEFVAVVPGLTRQEALDLADRLRSEIEGRPIEANGQTITVTVSVGVSTIARMSDPFAGIELADTALYAAKRAGRNLVRAA